MKQIIKKIKVQTNLILITGLHIGGNKDNVEIGGIDNPVITISSKNNQPYIPGSSLKGKMRCLLEQVEGVELGGNIIINKMFGSADAKNPSPSKLIVRDAYLTKKSLDMFETNKSSMDMPYTESKSENSIDRVKGVASNPRQTERVPAGAEFAVEFVINVWEDDEDGKLLNMLKKGIRLLENDYLGGSGSRGYGQVKFGELQITELSNANDWKA